MPGLVLILVVLLAWPLQGWTQQAQLINGNRTHAGATNYGITTGTGSAYVLTLNAAIPGYANGSCYLMQAHTANTGAASLNVNGRGARTLKKKVGAGLVDLEANDIIAGQLVEACTDGTVMQTDLGAPTGSTGGHTIKDETTTLPAQPILTFLGAGVTCSNNGGATATECTIPGGAGGFVDVSGTPTGGDVAVFVDANTVQGLTTLTATITDLDASTATRTRPHKTGTLPPATCAVGDTFFDTDAAAGQNIYGCTAVNTWTLEGGTSGGVSDGDKGDITVSGGGTVWAIDPNAVVLGTDTTGNYVQEVTAGAGLAKSSSASEGQTVDLSILSTEAGFLTDGGASNLTCGGGNQGKMQVMDNGTLQYCDGATTSVLQTAGHVIQDEGSPLALRTNLNLVGGGVLCTDSPGTNSTVCTIATGGTSLAVQEVDGSPSGTFTTLKFSNGSLTDNGDGSATIVTGAGGGGDVSSNTATSVDSEMALFSGTGGKTLKRATGTGLAKMTAGVLSTAIVGTDYQAPLGFTPVPETRTLTAGFGMQPMGDLSANRTVAHEAAAADDQVYVSDSTSDGTWRTLPNCTDTGGNHLNYTAATNTWSCGTSSSVLGAVTLHTTPYTAVAADFYAYKTLAVTGGTFPITLPATAPTHGYIWVMNYGSGTVTLEANGRLLNGQAADLSLPAGATTLPSQARIISTGTDYVVELMPSAQVNVTTATAFGAAGRVLLAGGPDRSATATTALTADGAAITSKVDKCTTLSADTTLGAHYCVYVDTSAASRIITLPAAASGINARQYEVYKTTAANTLTLRRSGSDTMNGTASDQTTTTQWAGFIIREQAATNWHVQTTVAPVGAASDTVAGLVELATIPETTTGTSTTLAVTPAALAGHARVRSVFLPAGNFDVNGSCVLASPAVLLTNGPKTVAITCTDATADSLETLLTMPDGWDAGTITVELTAFNIGTNASTLVYELSWIAKCVGPGEAPGAWAAVNHTTDAATSLSLTTTDNVLYHATSAAITPAGGCQPGDTLFLKGEVDASATTMTPMSDLKILGLKIEWTRNAND